MIEMEKLFSWDFALVLLFMLVLFFVHEYGHYLAYQILRIPAKIRRSLFAPGIDPKETVSVRRWQGLMIALGGGCPFFVGSSHAAVFFQL